MSEESNLSFLSDYFAEAVTDSYCSVACSQCQGKKCLLLSILMLCLLKKIKRELYKSMFMYSPWVCLLMMGVGVTDY